MNWDEYVKTEEAFIKQLEKSGNHELAEILKKDLEEVKEKIEKGHQEIAELKKQIIDLKNQIGEEKWNEIVSSVEVDEEEVKKLAEKDIIK